MNNEIITNLNKARAEIAKEFEYYSEEANKRKVQLENLDQLIKEQYQSYEIRNKGNNVNLIPQGELGYEPTKCIAYDKEVFRYTPNGEFVTSYKNTDEAQAAIRIEDDKPTLDCKSTIGYCCTGSYNPKPNVNHHMYKKRLFFDRKLTEEEIELCFELRIFNR